MIDLSYLNLYEILDVDPRATFAEIKKAYQIALKTYGTDHMATYPLFSEAEKEEILERVQEAYSVLMDPDNRKRYDEELRNKGGYPPERRIAPQTIDPESPQTVPTRIFGQQPKEDQAVREEKDRRVQEVLSEVEEHGGWSGEVLRQLREIRELSLDEIAQRTKIFRGHLRYMEEDSFEYLPPDTYLKGFLKQIAKVLDIDSDLLTQRMMEHVRRSRGAR
jgi:curved DNA-binding protein CbpA